MAVSGVFASDEFVRGQQFRGYKVEKYAELVARLGRDILIVIAFASERPEVLARFKELAAKHDVVAPHLPLFKEAELVSRAWLQRYAAELQLVYDKLADDISRKVLLTR
ncbi:methyltransferase, FkbM family [gut metagenome]|uniref:Methyltransferase, FkbM family n=1 Tax=gut metagenome TaxID=749906 RepID=J9G1X0_9ZZZZ